jgi:hypothetical protein
VFFGDDLVGDLGLGGAMAFEGIDAQGAGVIQQTLPRTKPRLSLASHSLELAIIESRNLKGRLVTLALAR